jgi:hypothetical protein
MTRATASCPVAPTTDIVARYERLRSAMLGEALPADARIGLIVFLRRGMSSWARMPTVEAARSQPASPCFSAPAQIIERRAIICLLAGMAMAISERRMS